jgi:hypothetical protein
MSPAKPQQCCAAVVQGNKPICNRRPHTAYQAPALPWLKNEAHAVACQSWKCEYEIGDMKLMSTLTIKKDGDKLAGTMSWPDQKEAKLKDVKLKDGDLTFSAERVFMDNKFTVEFKLMINGDKLKGKAAVETGGEKREFDIEGKREKKDK